MRGGLMKLKTKYFMKNKLFIFFLTLFGVFAMPQQILAIVNSLDSPNNKYGIHINGEGDFTNARELVNSNGGDWGYITFVIREDERDVKRWNKAFNELRSLHLIPLVRIASVQEGSSWKKLGPSKVNEWAEFFNRLVWPTQNRYVIVGNEPNHHREWGGNANPEEYAHYTCQLAATLKANNPNYFIISGGLDASAPNGKTTVSEETFLSAIAEKNRDFFNCLDGWSSHSYPNPNFSGASTAWGKGTVRTFLWEMEMLKKLGVKNDYPIFVTETGWARIVLNEKQISTRLQETAQNVWSHPQIVAVTPFILDYQTAPFANFSWKTSTGWTSYFTTYQDLPKTQGKPIIENTGEIELTLYPKITIGKTLPVFLEVKNTGQLVWNQDNLFVNVDNPKLNLEYKIESDVWPGDKKIIKVNISDGNSGKIEGALFLTNGTTKISNPTNVSAFAITNQNESQIIPTPGFWTRLKNFVIK